MQKWWYGWMTWICQYGMGGEMLQSFLYCFPNGEIIQWWIIFEGHKWWNGKITIWWNCDMFGLFEYVNFFVVKWWKSYDFFFLMVKWFSGVSIFWRHIFIRGDMTKWCCAKNGKMAKEKRMVKWLLWWNLTVDHMISSGLFILNSIHNKNHGDSDDIRAAYV